MSDGKDEGSIGCVDNQDIFPDSTAIERSVTSAEPRINVRKLSLQVEDAIYTNPKRQKVKENDGDVVVKPNQSIDSSNTGCFLADL